MIRKYVLRERKRLFSESVLREVLRHPIVTEKSDSAKAQGKYCFAVSSWAGKIAIARAVESVFGAKVKSVNTLNLKGKKCRFKGREGVRADTKKAIVSLEGGENLNLDFGGGVTNENKGI